MYHVPHTIYYVVSKMYHLHATLVLTVGSEVSKNKALNCVRSKWYMVCSRWYMVHCTWQEVRCTYISPTFGLCQYLLIYFWAS